MTKKDQLPEELQLNPDKRYDVTTVLKSSGHIDMFQNVPHKVALDLLTAFFFGNASGRFYVATSEMAYAVVLDDLVAVTVSVHYKEQDKNG